MRVLLVEDDAATAQSIELMLRAESFICDTTDLGEDGLEIGKLYDYDIIILDPMLPDIDGYEVLRRLRAARVKTPILILSGLNDLDARINTRVDAMFAQGLVAETQRLLQRGLAQNSTAMQAIGYRQVVEHLRGERSLPETIELVKIKTRQFAKRQMTWFRRHAPTARWLEIGQNDSLARVADEIAGTPPV